MESDKGGIGGIGGGGIGAGGSRKEKGLNTSKREAAAKRKARPDPPQHHDVPQPTPRVRYHF